MKYLVLFCLSLLLSAGKADTWTMVAVAGSADQHVFDNGTLEAAKVFRKKVGDVKFLSTSGKTASIEKLEDALKDNDGKCFLFMTSHGNRGGFLLGSDLLTPRELDRILTKHCPGPTVVVVSACFSGTFVYGPMQKPNRTILTAASPDRSSFGCSNDVEYTFWDECFLNNVLGAKDWKLAYNRTAYCVSERENALGYLPSKPLMFEGIQGKYAELLP